MAMARPRGETEKSLKDREEIAQHVLRANRARYDGYIWLEAMLYRLDGCFHQKAHWYQVPKLFFEAKQREIPFGHYKDGYMISVGKLVAAQYLYSVSSIRSALFARFTDGVVAGVMLSDHDCRFIIGGRDDRIQIMGEEKEPCVLIAWSKFKIIPPDPRQAAAAG